MGPAESSIQDILKQEGARSAFEAVCTGTGVDRERLSRCIARWRHYSDSRPKKLRVSRKMCGSFARRLVSLARDLEDVDRGLYFGYEDMPAPRRQLPPGFSIDLLLEQLRLGSQYLATLAKQEHVVEVFLPNGRGPDPDLVALAIGCNNSQNYVDLTLLLRAASGYELSPDALEMRVSRLRRVMPEGLGKIVLDVAERLEDEREHRAVDL